MNKLTGVTNKSILSSTMEVLDLTGCKLILNADPAAESVAASESDVILSSLMR